MAKDKSVVEPEVIVMGKCPSCGHNMILERINLKIYVYCPMNMPYYGCGYRISWAGGA